MIPHAMINCILLSTEYDLPPLLSHDINSLCSKHYAVKKNSATPSVLSSALGSLSVHNPISKIGQPYNQDKCSIRNTRPRSRSEACASFTQTQSIGVSMTRCSSSGVGLVSNLSLRPKVFRSDSKRALPRDLFPRQTNGLLKMIANTQPWNESVTKYLQSRIKRSH